MEKKKTNKQVQLEEYSRILDKMKDLGSIYWSEKKMGKVEITQRIKGSFF